MHIDGEIPGHAASFDKLRMRNFLMVRTILMFKDILMVSLSNHARGAAEK
jgi:hypothetical protein